MMFPATTKILIIDDMAMFRSMVKQALSALNFKRYEEAADGLAGWNAIEKAQQTSEPFELIISDWNMPKMKGVEVLKKVRAERWGINLPFIMLTGETEKATIVEAIQSGVSQYIVKPFTIESLKAKLQVVYDQAKSTSSNIIIEE